MPGRIAPSILSADSDILVAGSSVFQGNIKENLKNFTIHL